MWQFALSEMIISPSVHEKYRRAFLLRCGNGIMQPEFMCAEQGFWFLKLHCLGCCLFRGGRNKG